MKLLEKTLSSPFNALMRSKVYFLIAFSVLLLGQLASADVMIEKDMQLNDEVKPSRYERLKEAGNEVIDWMSGTNKNRNRGKKEQLKEDLEADNGGQSSFNPYGLDSCPSSSEDESPMRKLPSKADIPQLGKNIKNRLSEAASKRGPRGYPIPVSDLKGDSWEYFGGKDAEGKFSGIGYIIKNIIGDWRSGYIGGFCKGDKSGFGVEFFLNSNFVWEFFPMFTTETGKTVPAEMEACIQRSLQALNTCTNMRAVLKCALKKFHVAPCAPKPEELAAKEGEEPLSDGFQVSDVSDSLKGIKVDAGTRLESTSFGPCPESYKTYFKDSKCLVFNSLKHNRLAVKLYSNTLDYHPMFKISDMTSDYTFVPINPVVKKNGDKIYWNLSKNKRYVVEVGRDHSDPLGGVSRGEYSMYFDSQLDSFKKILAAEDCKCSGNNEAGDRVRFVASTKSRKFDVQDLQGNLVKHVGTYDPEAAPYVDTENQTMTFFFDGQQSDLGAGGPAGKQRGDLIVFCGEESEPVAAGTRTSGTTLVYYLKNSSKLICEEVSKAIYGNTDSIKPQVRDAAGNICKTCMKREGAKGLGAAAGAGNGKDKFGNGFGAGSSSGNGGKGKPNAGGGASNFDASAEIPTGAGGTNPYGSQRSGLGGRPDGSGSGGGAEGAGQFGVTAGGGGGADSQIGASGDLDDDLTAKSPVVKGDKISWPLSLKTPMIFTEETESAKVPHFNPSLQNARIFHIHSQKQYNTVYSFMLFSATKNYFPVLRLYKANISGHSSSATTQYSMVPPQETSYSLFTLDADTDYVVEVGTDPKGRRKGLDTGDFTTIINTQDQDLTSIYRNTIIRGTLNSKTYSAGIGPKLQFKITEKDSAAEIPLGEMSPEIVPLINRTDKSILVTYDFPNKHTSAFLRLLCPQGAVQNGNQLFEVKKDVGESVEVDFTCPAMCSLANLIEAKK